MSGNINKHAYLLIVDKHPMQIRTLLELLDHKRNDIFIHIDAKSKMISSDINTCGLISKVRIYKEINVYWSDISLTEVELFLLKKAREFNHYEYYHLISGSDLPIKSQEEILEFYDSNKGKEFVEYQIPGRFLSKEYYSRVKYYHLFTKHYRHEGRFRLLKDYFFVCIEYIALFFQMIFRINRIKGLEFARGSQWFDITDNLAAYVLSKSEWILKQFRMTRASDESFLPLIVHNSEYRTHLFCQTFDGDMHANMRFIDWKRGDPYLFHSSDFNELISSDLLFARKFNEDVDNDIIIKIKEYVLGKKGTYHE